MENDKDPSLLEIYKAVAESWPEMNTLQKIGVGASATLFGPAVAIGKAMNWGIRKIGNVIMYGNSKGQ